MVEFRILGPFEVADDGTPLPLGGRKQRAVLALLLLEAGRTVSTDRLVEALWGEEPPRTAATSLQNFVSHLRKLVGPDVLVTKPPGYQLRVAPEQVDLGRFQQLVEASATLDAPERAALLREALELWHGPPLADFTYDAFAQDEIRRLEDLRLGTLERRIEADLEAGRHRELVPELERLTAEHPLREPLVGQLMLALCRSGRSREATNVYQELRLALAEQVGLDPDPAVQDLYRQILRGEAPPGPAPRRSTSDHCDEVADALLSGSVVPILGADVGGLASLLAERFGYPEAERPELTRVAQWVALTKGSGPLYDELHALLASRTSPTTVHRFFAALPPLLRERGIEHQLLVTTGYDLALEQALLDAGEELDVVTYVASGRHRGKFCHLCPDGSATTIDVPNTYVAELSLERRTVVLKLHGGLDSRPEREAESFVVTEDDYIDYLGQADVAGAIPVALAAKLRRSHFLFLGYGMREWNARLVLSRIWGEPTLTYRSWAVESSPQALEREFWRRRDVDLVEAPLERYVEELAARVGLGALEAA